MSLPIPASATVLSLVGLNFNISDYMPQALRGVYATAPYTMRKVQYPASISINSITEGVKSLNTAIRSVKGGGQVVVFGHSQGAQVASRWMRQYAADTTAPDSTRLTFILIGNPLRSTGGYGIGRPEIDGAIGQPTPTTTRWTIVDIARRYDGWADWVTDESNRRAVDNANSGKVSLHMHYENVDPNATSNTVWSNGNTTYVLTAESPPLLNTLLGQLPPSIITAAKKKCEQGYANRPVSDPPVTVVPPESSWWVFIKFYLGL